MSVTNNNTQLQALIKSLNTNTCSYAHNTCIDHTNKINKMIIDGKIIFDTLFMDAFLKFLTLTKNYYYGYGQSDKQNKCIIKNKDVRSILEALFKYIPLKDEYVEVIGTY